MSTETKPHIEWFHSLDEAFEVSKATGKKVMLDFFNPGWGGCKKMGAVTYPDANVASFVNQNFVPVQINILEHPVIPEHYVSTWTPSILYIDPDGRVHRRHYGYRLPEDMIVEMRMGLAWEAFDNKRYDEAIERFEKIVSDFPRSFLAPEALYMVGVSRYRATDDGSNLDKYWDMVMERYPGSIWAKAGDV